MVTTEFTTQLMRGILGIVGNIVTLSTSNSGVKEQEKIFDTHYKASKKAADEYEKETREGKHEPVDINLELSEPTKKKLELMNENIDYNVDKLDRRMETEQQAIQPYKDMTDENIQDGTACVACSSDHLTLASSLLDEAYTFAIRPKFGMTHPEVRKRIQDATKQLLAMERVDLAPSQIDRLQGKEKELAIFARNASSDIRHNLKNTRTPDDLENVAGDLSKSAQKFTDDVWGLAIDDGSLDEHIDDICKGLDGEQKQRCLSRLNRLMDEKGK